MAGGQRRPGGLCGAHPAAAALHPGGAPHEPAGAATQAPAGRAQRHTGGVHQEAAAGAPERSRHLLHPGGQHQASTGTRCARPSAQARCHQQLPDDEHSAAGDARHLHHLSGLGPEPDPAPGVHHHSPVRGAADPHDAAALPHPHPDQLQYGLQPAVRVLEWPGAASGSHRPQPAGRQPAARPRHRPAPAKNGVAGRQPQHPAGGAGGDHRGDRRGQELPAAPGRRF